jgi:hypothetical protein
MKQIPFLAPVLFSIAVLLSFSGLSQNRQPSRNNPYYPKKQPTHGRQPVYYRLDSLQPQKPWSWNLLFKPGTRKAVRTKAVEKLESEVQTAFTKLIGQPRYLGKYLPKLLFNVYTCPCDSLLYTLNVEATLITGAGKVATQPPPPPPDPKGGGNAVIGFNYAVSNLDTVLTSDNNPNQGGYNLPSPAHLTVDQSNILAIMDTGLDPDRFPSFVKKLIWQDGTAPTLFNFLPGRPVGKFMDDHPERHGSGVTGMALGEIKNGSAYPAIMIMKVLDSAKMGSIFSVSCALSYARQHHAKVINMSLGYYSNTRVDSILNHYIKSCVKASPHPITIFAAAGNIMTSPHAPDSLCSNKFIHRNLLGPDRLFYPACLNINYPHLVSVTGLTDNLKTSCYYQNYSETFVTVGLVKRSKPAVSCCTYKFPFSNAVYEGTSFATPVVAGIVMNSLVTGSGKSALTVLNSLKKPSGLLKNVTEKGHYITY